MCIFDYLSRPLVGADGIENLIAEAKAANEAFHLTRKKNVNRVVMEKASDYPGDHGFPWVLPPGQSSWKDFYPKRAE